MMSKFSILFCCMGNICRSPMAAALFRQEALEAGILDRIAVDSAGTHAYFPNSPADPRAQRALETRSIDISDHRARRITHDDFERFDLILVMDRDNYDALQFVCPKEHLRKIGRLLEYVPASRVKDIPDPYHADESAFIDLLHILEPAVKGLAKHLCKNF